MKRCSVLLVALLMVITMLPGTALAEEELITLRVMGPSATLTAGSEQMTFDEWMHSGSPLVNAFNEGADESVFADHDAMIELVERAAQSVTVE